MESLRIDGTNEPDDAQLVEGARARDETAIRLLIQRYNRRLYRVARSMVGNDADAEDVLQEAYVRAFSAFDGFRGESRISTWLTRIVVNEALQFLRRRKSLWNASDALRDLREQGDVIPFPAQTSLPDPETTMAQNEICALVERAIDALPQEFRTVLVARTIEGMSIEETADALELKPETVKTRLHRARQMLKSALDLHLEAQFSSVFPFDGARCNRMADAVVARLAQPGGNLSS